MTGSVSCMPPFVIGRFGHATGILVAGLFLGLDIHWRSKRFVGDLHLRGDEILRAELIGVTLLAVEAESSGVCPVPADRAGSRMVLRQKHMMRARSHLHGIAA